MQSFRVVVGMDWGDEKHAIFLLDQQEDARESGEVEQTPEAVADWVTSLRHRFPDTSIAVCLEQTRGALIYSLMKYEFLSLVPINPKQLASFREAISAIEAKNDPDDAELLAELFAKHGDHLRIWKPDNEETRFLTSVCEDRRHLVNQRTALTNRLTSQLKQYFPQALQLSHSVRSPLMCALLERWSSLAEIQQATDEEIGGLFHECRCYSRTQRERRLRIIRHGVPLTTDRAIVASRQLQVQGIVRQIKDLNNSIETYDRKIENAFAAHPDYAIFHSFPGAGPIMGPRLLCAFGSDRERFSSASDVQTLSGIAPVTKKSGKSKVVHRRWACNKFLRQTFHEYAGRSINHSAWARAYYLMMKQRTDNHNTALRALAFKWIRILYRCWKDRRPYDESTYVESLRRRHSPIVKYLAPCEQED